MDVTYSNGPRYIDGVNIDSDISADFAVMTELEISDPVTDLIGRGYEPGQKNADGTPL